MRPVEGSLSIFFRRFRSMSFIKEFWLALCAFLSAVVCFALIADNFRRIAMPAVIRWRRAEALGYPVGHATTDAEKS